MGQKSAYLDLTIISAEDLKRKWLSGDQTEAVAWVDPSAKKTTSIVSGKGPSVQWHEKLILTLDGVDTLLQGKLLTIEIHARGSLGDSLLGSVYVPLAELVSDGEKRGGTTLMYQIVQPSGKRQGSMKFLAKVVKPRVSGCIAPLSASVVPLPSAPAILPLEDSHNGLGSNALYPPASAMCPVERLSPEANAPYPTLGVSPYPPQLHFSQNYATGHDASPHVYPPVYTAHPPHTSASCSPHSNYTGIIPYPPPSLPGLEIPYLPPASVYPPPTMFSEAPYPPIAPRPPYPLTALHSSEMYSPENFNPYSSPLYPPPYPQQQATVLYPYRF